MVVLPVSQALTAKFSTTRHVRELNRPRNWRNTRVSSCAIISQVPSLLARLYAVYGNYEDLCYGQMVHVPWVTSAVPSWGHRRSKQYPLPSSTLYQAVPFTKLLNELYSVPVTPSTLGLERSVSETRHALEDGGYRCLSSNVCFCRWLILPKLIQCAICFVHCCFCTFFLCYMLLARFLFALLCILIKRSKGKYSTLTWKI